LLGQPRPREREREREREGESERGRGEERVREGERERERIRKDVRERVIGSLFHVGNQHSTWTLFSPVGHEFNTLVLQRRQHGIVIL